jgi:hypothetical protein
MILAGLTPHPRPPVTWAYGHPSPRDLLVIMTSVCLKQRQSHDHDSSSHGTEPDHEDLAPSIDGTSMITELRTSAQTGL